MLARNQCGSSGECGVASQAVVPQASGSVLSKYDDLPDVLPAADVRRVALGYVPHAPGRDEAKAAALFTRAAAAGAPTPNAPNASMRSAS